MDYSDQLLDSRWMRLRSEILERDNHQCQDCLICKDLRPSVKLHVHHLEYHDGKMAWEYDQKYLITLCDSCHEKAHGLAYDHRDAREKPTRIYKEHTDSKGLRHISHVMREYIGLLINPH